MKRIISLLLVVLISLFTLPNIVLAETTEYDVTITAKYENSNGQTENLNSATITIYD